MLHSEPPRNVPMGGYDYTGGGQQQQQQRFGSPERMGAPQRQAPGPTAGPAPGRGAAQPGRGGVRAAVLLAHTCLVYRKATALHRLECLAAAAK